jgi:integrase
VKGAFPQAGLRFPKSEEKPPFQTYAEIERQLTGSKLSKVVARRLWDALFLTLPQLEEVLDHVRQTARHPFVYPMFAFAAYTGARRSEVLRCELRDVDFAANAITIREKKRAKGKLTTRRVPMSPRLLEALKGWIAVRPEGSFLFSLPERLGKSAKRHEGGTPMTPHEAQSHFRYAVKASKWKVMRGWHVFRHSFCSNLAAQGIDQRLIDAWVGHTTEEMRRRYRHLVPSVEQAVMKSIFGDPNGKPAPTGESVA